MKLFLSLLAAVLVCNQISALAIAPKIDTREAGALDVGHVSAHLFNVLTSLGEYTGSSRLLR